MNSAAGMRYGECFCLTGGGSLDFTHHLAEIEFGNDESFHFGCEFTDLFFGERPGGDQAQLSDVADPFRGRLRWRVAPRGR